MEPASDLPEQCLDRWGRSRSRFHHAHEIGVSVPVRQPSQAHTQHLAKDPMPIENPPYPPFFKGGDLALS